MFQKLSNPGIITVKLKLAVFYIDRLTLNVTPLLCINLIQIACADCLRGSFQHMIVNPQSNYHGIVHQNLWLLFHSFSYLQLNYASSSPSCSPVLYKQCSSCLLLPFRAAETFLNASVVKMVELLWTACPKFAASTLSLGSTNWVWDQVSLTDGPKSFRSSMYEVGAHREHLCVSTRIGISESFDLLGKLLFNKLQLLFNKLKSLTV